jgi:hypothetical protein
MRRTVVLIAWYFLSYAPGYSHSVGVGVVVGPFKSQDDCETMVSWARAHANTSWCWYTP